MDDMKDYMQMEESAYSYTKGCEAGIPESCGPNEECERNNAKSRAGTCRCKVGFIRNGSGHCMIDVTFKDDVAINGMPDSITEQIITLSNVTTKKQLVVIAENKEVKLPVSEVSLMASVSPPPTSDEKYQYEWTSLHQPEGSSAVKQQNSEQLKLTKLSEGLYTFKVIQIIFYTIFSVLSMSQPVVYCSLRYVKFSYGFLTIFCWKTINNIV